MKIASRALTPPLEKVISQIIHVDQYQDTEGRTMFDAIHTIENIIQNIKGQQMCGLMVAFNLILESVCIILSAEYS